MITFDEARKKGIKACMDKIGFEFCLKNKENACTSYSDYEDRVFCFVGIDDDYKSKSDNLVLSSKKGFKYTACCNVYKSDGNIIFVKNI